MNAIFFGSLSVVVDTSEQQRKAFNAAFKEAGLDWDWSADTYRDLLTSSGGRDRIADYARARGDDVDAGALHLRKSEIFQDILRQGGLPLRPLTAEMMDYASGAGLRTAFVTGTSAENIEALMAGFGGADALGFDLVTSGADAQAGKPDPAIYHHALSKMGLDSSDVLAVEDNVPGLNAAQAAGIRCLAYPNENTAHHDFDGATPAAQWQSVISG